MRICEASIAPPSQSHDLEGRAASFASAHSEIIGRDGSVHELNERPTVPYLSIYRYCTTYDFILIVVGTIGAICGGAALPVFSILLGEMIETFGDSNDVSRTVDEINDLVIWFIVLAVVAAITSALEMYCWMQVGIRQSNIIREKYLRAVMRQDIGFFDTEATTGGMIGTLNEDTADIQEGMNDKIATFIHNLAAALAAIGIGFWRAWDIFIVLLSAWPALVMAGFVFAKTSEWLKKRTEKAYNAANSVAQESFSNIRVVAAYNGESAQHHRYWRLLDSVRKVVPPLAFGNGLSLGLFQFCVFGTYALTFYWGGRLVADGKRTGGDVINIMFATMIGGFSLGQAAPYVRYFKMAQLAGARVFNIIERKVTIDPDAPGETLDQIDGRIELKNVFFSYPARPDVPIFTGLNLVAEAGKTLALVGGSGSGKSTVVALVMRWYNPSSGRILIDGNDLCSLQLRWLRSQMGLVAQEPALFATSIRENILYGRPDATDEEIEEAAKAANAHEFISRLPDGYETSVGEKGGQLSGGQKQRIAIARAVLRNPKILLLDEATSALDTKSERQVQVALENLMSSGRTTIVIAHRLSTIRKADKIAVMKEGKVVEQGTHFTLTARPGSIYGELISLQKQAEKAAMRKQGGFFSGFGARATEREDTMAPGGEEEDRKEIVQVAKPEKVKVSFRRLLGMNKPEIPFFVFGVIMCFVAGTLMPAFSYMMATVLSDLFHPDPDVVRDRAEKWSLIMFILAIIAITTITLQQASFFYMGQQLAYRLKVLYFRHVLAQEISFFDRPENGSGALVASLGRDTGYVKGAVGDQVGLILQNLTVMTLSWGIAIYYGWELALVMIACMPVVASSFAIRGKFFRSGLGDNAGEMFAKANGVAMDAFGNIRIIAGFGLDEWIAKLYHRYVAGPAKSAMKKAAIVGALWGYSNGVLFAFYALSWWWAGQLLEDGKLTASDIFRAFFAVLLANIGLMQAMQAFPDVGKSRAAIQRIFTAVDHRPTIDSLSPSGDELSQVTGEVVLRNVDFRYPTRPQMPVFQAFSLRMEAGKHTALVGQSGSGKSTVIALVLRYYDPAGGAVLLDGRDIRDLNVAWLRRQMGLVSQEPALFATSIRDNIAFGTEDPSEEEIVSAAKAANAWEFISGLPDGIDTFVGERGTQLSGGQKQRIAIARAVLRNPRILLLDEATSALDTKSESIVQQALDKLIGGRTTIVVAHRLSTIVGADKIAVVQDGQVLEEGTHRQLVGKRNGAYAALCKMQM